MELSERQRAILDRIRTSGTLLIEELAAEYGLTTQTLRRDINTLCELGLARRFHGGVGLPVSSRNISVAARATLHAEAKRAIARRLAADIPAGATVFLGIGTTVVFVAEALREHDRLTIVTNNLDAALVLADAESAAVHVAGGVLRRDDRDVVGGETLRSIARFRTTHAVLGAGALDAAHGVMDFSEEEAEIGGVALGNTAAALLVADGSKWGRGAMIKVAPFSRFSAIYTDEVPEGAPRAALAGCGAEIILCGSR